MAGNDQPIAVALDNATVAFRVAGDRVYTAVRTGQPVGGAGRVRRHRRADRLR